MFTSTSKSPASVRHVEISLRASILPSIWTRSAFDSSSLRPSARSRAPSSRIAAANRSRLASSCRTRTVEVLGKPRSPVALCRHPTDYQVLDVVTVKGAYKGGNVQRLIAALSGRRHAGRREEERSSRPPRPKPSLGYLCGDRQRLLSRRPVWEEERLPLRPASHRGPGPAWQACPQCTSSQFVGRRAAISGLLRSPTGNEPAVPKPSGWVETTLIALVQLVVPHFRGPLAHYSRKGHRRSTSPGKLGCWRQARPSGPGEAKRSRCSAKMSAVTDEMVIDRIDAGVLGSLRTHSVVWSSRTGPATRSPRRASGTSTSPALGSSQECLVDFMISDTAVSPWPSPKAPIPKPSRPGWATLRSTSPSSATVTSSASLTRPSLLPLVSGWQTPRAKRQTTVIHAAFGGQ
jgi:hypothetical protein